MIERERERMPIGRRRRRLARDRAGISRPTSKGGAASVGVTRKSYWRKSRFDGGISSRAAGPPPGPMRPIGISRPSRRTPARRGLIASRSGSTSMARSMVRRAALSAYCASCESLRSSATSSTGRSPRRLGSAWAIVSTWGSTRANPRVAFQAKRQGRSGRQARRPNARRWAAATTGHARPVRSGRAAAGRRRRPCVRAARPGRRSPRGSDSGTAAPGRPSASTRARRNRRPGCGSTPRHRCRGRRPQAGGHGGSRPAAGAAGYAVERPGVPGRAEQGRVGDALGGELRQVRLADDDRPGRPQPSHGDGVLSGTCSAKRCDP